jgi:hypothetical protein
MDPQEERIRPVTLEPPTRAAERLLDAAPGVRVVRLVRADELHRAFLLEVLVEAEIEPERLGDETALGERGGRVARLVDRLHDRGAQLVVFRGRALDSARGQDRPDRGQGPGRGAHGLLEEHPVARSSIAGDVGRPPP